MSMLGCGSCDLRSALEGTEGLPERPGHRLSPGHPAQLQLQPTRRHRFQVPLRLGTWPPPRPAAAGGRPGHHGTLASNPASPTLARETRPPACSEGRRSLDGALAPPTRAFISAAPGSFW